MKRRISILGLFLLILGVLILLFNSQNMVGFVIAENTMFPNFFTFLGLVLFASGLLIMSFVKARKRGDKRSRLELNVLEEIGEEKWQKLSDNDKEAVLKSHARYLEKLAKKGPKYETGYLEDRDKVVFENLSEKEKPGYVPIKQQLKEDEKILGGDSKFFIGPLEKGQVTYVHLTKGKKIADSIKEKGLLKGGKNTYSQAFIFTGEDSEKKAEKFVESLSSDGSYLGINNPTHAIIFKTPVVPKINKASGKTPRNYKTNWKALFEYNLNPNLMQDVKYKKIRA